MNPYASSLTDTNCDALWTEWDGESVTMDNIIALDEEMAIDSGASAEIEAGITILNEYNNVDEDKYATILNNDQSIYFVGINSIKQQITDLETIVGTTLPAAFTSVLDVFTNMSTETFDMTTFITDSMTLLAEASTHIATVFADSNMAVRVYHSNWANFTIIKPYNILQQVALVQQIVGDKSEDTFTGFQIDYDTFAVVPNSQMSPIKKTLTNCVAPLVFPLLVAEPGKTAVEAVPIGDIADMILGMLGAADALQDTYTSITDLKQYDDLGYSD